MRTLPDALRLGLSATVSASVRRRFLSCLWELTYRCNARCAICSYWRNPSEPMQELGLDEIDQALVRLHHGGCRMINFTGGEPTLRSDLEGIVRRASQMGFWTSIVTNGSTLTRDRIGELKKSA
jgi:pyrroloquinoline quinone biosynthesis protein E